MQDTPERPAPTLPQRSLRPPPLGHTWAWIIISVSVVILISITMWVVVSGNTVVNEIGDRESVHQIVSKWRERWKQAPGPPEVYSQQASSYAMAGEMALATRRLSMALALDSNRGQDWAHMVCLSAIRPPLEFGLSSAEIGTILSLLDEEMVSVETLNIARDWEQITQTKGPPFPLVLQCLGGSSGSPSAKTGRETLDTLPVSP